MLFYLRSVSTPGVVHKLRQQVIIFEKLIELVSAIANRLHTEEKDIIRFSVNREVDQSTQEPTDTLILIET